MHSWTAYERFAWGHDELQPLTNTSNDVWGGFAVTMIDCLDTAKIMGLDAEFERMVAFLDANFTMQRNHYVSVFELSIRVLGGLLGAFDLSGGDPRLLRMADEAGTALLGAFPTDGDGLPAAELNIVKSHRRNHPWARSMHTLAEVGSVQLELGRLAAVLRAARGAVPPRLEAASRSMSHVLRARSSNGLYPRGLEGSESYAINGGADSFYEYLLKLWLIGGRKEAALWRAYAAAVKGIDEGLVRRSRPSAARRGQEPTVFVGELQGDSEVNVMEHLACFAPGMIALGVARGAAQLSRDEAANHTRLATQLAETCWRLYADTATGLAPDTIRFDPEQGTYLVSQPKYSLRPETVESLFFMWRLTHDATWRERGWKIFLALQQQCRTASGYAALRDVRRARSYEDSMPSFWMAETLKYLYLLFSEDDVLPLDQWVFNTEAHPFRVEPG